MLISDPRGFAAESILDFMVCLVLLVNLVDLLYMVSIVYLVYLIPVK